MNAHCPKCHALFTHQYRTFNVGGRYLIRCQRCGVAFWIRFAIAELEEAPGRVTRECTGDTVA